MASLSKCAGWIFAEIRRVDAAMTGWDAADNLSAVFISHPLSVGGHLKLLSDEPAERLQRLLAIRFRDHFPELLQRDQFQRRLRPGKKAPSWLDRMAFLLEPSYDNLEANPRASKERKMIIAEIRRWVDSG
jgi:hypothetical protein